MQSLASVAMTVDRKIVLVTGAAAGIGLEAVKALLSSEHASYEILLSARKLTQAQAASEQVAAGYPSSSSGVVPLELDVESDESIEAAANHVKANYGRLDALINNAVAGEQSLRDGWKKAWDVNVTGAHITTNVFVPLLLESNDPRLLFITSSTSTLTGTENGDLPVNKPSNKGWPKTAMRTMVPSYRCSKTGLNMVMREWHRMLRDDGVKVFSISPGFLATKLGGDQEANKNMGAGNPALGGTLIKDVVEGQKDTNVGKIISQTGIQPW
ncbi:hypothetical protein NQ176_g7951 [Zarea fungicola]|uniref:Uncharacterized protein n=1 Tax=Zarea fungicola TaxID=93591 RepID=A0ACC1MV84_9HYPO|nr:hypothetical protein NQ176_g7951 [Lecanicillium fungicola]